jgi:hypothetical protein
MKPFWEILAFLTTSKKFSSEQVAHYNKYTLKNLCIFITLKNLCIFHQGRSPVTTRPLWKIFVFFITLKNLRIFHLDRSPITTRSIWKIYAFFTTLKNLCIFHLFEKSLHFSPGQVTHYNKTTSKNKPFFNFLWVGHPWQFDHFKISEFLKEKSFSFYFECAF